MRIENIVFSHPSSGKEVSKIFSHGVNQSIQSWEFRKDKMNICSHENIDKAIFVNICPKNNVIVGLISNSPFIWNLEEGSASLIEELSHLKISSLVCLDSKDIFIATDRQHLQLCDWESKKVTQTFEGDLRKYSVAIDHSLGILATCINSSIKVWDLSTNKEMFNFHKGDALILALHIFHVDSTYLLISGGLDGYIKVWDLNTGKLAYCLHDDNNAPINSIAIEPIRNIVIVGRWNGSIELWDLKTGNKLCDFQGHKNNRVRCVIVSPDNELIASCGWDGMVKVWKIHNQLTKYAMLSY